MFLKKRYLCGEKFLKGMDMENLENRVKNLEKSSTVAAIAILVLSIAILVISIIK